MLRKPWRLRSDKSFKQTLAGRRLCATACFSVFISQSPPSLKYPRFGIVVSKKVDKRATRRNRVKRRIREIIRTQLLPVIASEPFSWLNHGYFVVILVRQGALSADYDTLASQLMPCFQKRVK